MWFKKQIKGQVANVDSADEKLQIRDATIERLSDLIRRFVYTLPPDGSLSHIYHVPAETRFEWYLSDLERKIKEAAEYEKVKKLVKRVLQEENPPKAENVQTSV